MYEIVRWFEIDAGHRVPKHESKCKNLHGHRYKIGVFVSSEVLDPVGRVMDFGSMKDVFGEWLNEYWDHGLIMQADDEWVALLSVLNEQKLYLMSGAPTAENMAEFLYNTFREVHPGVTKVVVYETPNCSATYPGGVVGSN